MVVAPVFERILGDHRAGQAQPGGSLQLLDAVLDVVQVDHRDAFEAGGIGAAEIGEPVVVRAKYRGHQRRVRHPEVKQALRGIDDFAGDPIELHVLEVLPGVVPAADARPQAALGGNALRGLEPRTGVRDEADPGEDLIRLDNDLIGSVDPPYSRRAIPEGRVDTGLPQIGRFEHMRVGRKNQGQHRHFLSHPIGRQHFGDRPSSSRSARRWCARSAALGIRLIDLWAILLDPVDLRSGRAGRLGPSLPCPRTVPASYSSTN